MVEMGVLPKVEPVPPATFLVLLFFVAVPPFGFIYGFSAMGVGLTYVEGYDETWDAQATLAALGVCAIMSCLYLLDFSLWKSAIGRFIRVSSLVIVAALVVYFILMSARTRPHGLIVLYTLGTVCFFISGKHLFYSEVKFRNYVSWLTGPLLFSSVATLIAFFVWVNSDAKSNEWSPETKVAYAKRLKWDKELLREDIIANDLVRCLNGYNETLAQKDFSAGSDQINFEGYLDEYDKANNNIYIPCFGELSDERVSYFDDASCPMYCEKIYDTCTVSFILWATPLIISLVLFFLSFVCAFLNPESAANAPTTFGKIFMVLLFGLWCTASLSGAGAGLTESFAAFFLGACGSIAMIVIATFGVPSSKDDLHNMEVFRSFKKKYGWAVDYMRAMIVVTSFPLVFMYTVVSVLNQSIRKLGIPCSKKLDRENGEHKLWCTKMTSDQIKDFKTWDHAKIYSWGIIMGLVYMVMQVICAKFTVLFLSWMKIEASKLGFLAVTGIILAVGMTLFLLPPVPGVPIYLTGGLMIPAVATEEGKNIDGFPGGILGAVCYTCVISVLLKLCACTLQQKLFGENMSTNVKIRQAVSVNSSAIRTMKLILQQPGITVPKVAILVGGPDWPTSVLCGIMRLPLLQILLGTLPVFFLIVPTVLAGTFMWMAGLIDENGQPQYDYASTLATLFMVIAAMVQSGSMVVAAYHLERAVSTRGDELEKIPIDQEVKDADDRNLMRNLTYKYVTQWHLVPWFWKKILHLSLFLITTSCYMQLIFTVSVPYTLQDTPDDKLDGKWYKLLNDLGWLMMGLFFLSFLLLNRYYNWAFKKVNEFEKSGQQLPPEYLAQLNSDEEAGGEGEGVEGNAGVAAVTSGGGGSGNKVVPMMTDDKAIT